MQKIIKSLPLIGLLVSVLFFVSCGANNASNNGDSPSHQTQEESQVQDPSQFNWSVTVNDSATVTMGNVESTTYLDFTVANDAKGIKGHYTGTGSGKTLNTNAAYDSNSQAGAENTLAIDFTISDALAPLVPPNGEDDNDALAPLVPQDDDDALAPLVPNDDDALAPLTNESQNADYEGAGTITIAPRTAVVEGRGVSATKKLDGQTFPVNIFVYGESVRLELKTPQGSVYFDGKIKKSSD